MHDRLGEEPDWRPREETTPPRKPGVAMMKKDAASRSVHRGARPVPTQSPPPERSPNRCAGLGTRGRTFVQLSARVVLFSILLELLVEAVSLPMVVQRWALTSQAAEATTARRRTDVDLLQCGLPQGGASLQDGQQWPQPRALTRFEEVRVRPLCGLSDWVAGLRTAQQHLRGNHRNLRKREDLGSGSRKKHGLQPCAWS